MSIEKPLPLMVGNKAYYSLTSYDPVEIEVDVPYTTDEDVDLGLQMTLQDLGGTPDDLNDPAWVSEHFEGLSTANEVREHIRQQVFLMNSQLAEQQKLGKCVEALSTRLCQSIPPQHIEQTKQLVRMRFTQQLQADGLTPNQFLERTGTTAAQLDTMFDRQAQQAAEGDAALSAYAHEKKLKVDEQEYARLLGMPPAEAQDIINQAKAAGQADELREAALRAKAAQIVVAECSCTYNHETAAQARARVAQYRQMREMFDRSMADEPEEEEPDHSGFKLV